jgi:Ser/Thr protein kinase RdoA (MazF antagonist)
MIDAMDGLAEHLQVAYGVTVTGLSELDRGVHRVRLADGRDWVARTFAGTRPLAVVRDDAQILRGLENGGFPAERLAADDAVTVLEDRPVLVTRFVAGQGPTGARAWAILGALLGALHAAPTDRAPPGGAWHHLAVGTPRDEIAAAIELLERVSGDAPVAQLAAFGTLLDELERLDAAADLPQSLVHPDFVPVNAIEDEHADPGQPGRGVVVVDWTGAGRGPRLWSLAFCLWAGGGRNPKLVDLIVSRYRRRITLEPEELHRLAAVMAARPLLLDCWRIAHHGRSASDVVAGLVELKGTCERIAALAREAFADRSA